MADYLREVGRLGRVLATLGMALATLLCGAILLLLLDSLLRGQFLFPGGKPIWPVALLMGFLTFASGWMLVRLLRGTRSANGVTLMPTWFIELFGMVFAAMGVAMAVLEKQPLFLLECFSVAGAMILVRRHLRRRRQPEEETP